MEEEIYKRSLALKCIIWFFNCFGLYSLILFVKTESFYTLVVIIPCLLFLSFYTCHSHSRASVFSTLMPVFSTALSILSIIVCTPLVLFSYVLCIINYSLKKYRRYIFTNCLISATCFCAVSKPWGNMKLRYILAVRRNSMKGTSCSSQQLL